MATDIDPISQFELKRYVPLEIAGIDLSFTNASLFMLAAVAVICGTLALAGQNAQLVPNRLQSVVEMVLDFVRNTILTTIGEDGLKFFPLVFTLFTFILALNLFGMSPFAFTVTSHLSVTAALAAMVFAIVLWVGFSKSGLGFFSRFYPSGAPAWIGWLIAIIEVISFLVRPFTLAIRLFANMLAGHTMLKVLAYLVPMGLGALATGAAAGLLAALSALFGIVSVTALEFLVAGLQAYIFTVLTCIYLSEVVHEPHH